MAYNGIKVAHIVATDLNGCIGKDGKIPWHIPTDLKRFKELTTGGVVIMGRKTFDSLGSKPLPNRMNIVVTKNHDNVRSLTVSGDLWSSLNLKDGLGMAARRAESRSHDTIWIIGGAEIYAQTMQYVDVIEATIVNTKISRGDAFYDRPLPPYRLTELSNTMTDEKSGLTYRYSKHVKFLSSEVGNE